MPRKATTTTAPEPPRLHAITLAFIKGDKITYDKTHATSHLAALQAAERSPGVTVRAFYFPKGVSLSLAAMHVTASTLSGIARRGVGDVPRQQRQLATARKALHLMAQHGANAIAAPFDIADLFQTAALALVNHTAPLSGITPPDIQAAYSAAMCAVQKAYRADTRGVQQAQAGQELPRLPGSPTMRTSAPPRPAPKAYLDALSSIRRALPSEQARAVFDAWREHPETSARELSEYVDGKKSATIKHVAKIRDIANTLFPDGIAA